MDGSLRMVDLYGLDNKASFSLQKVNLLYELCRLVDHFVKRGVFL